MLVVVATGNEKAAEKEALAILAKKTNWRNLQPVSADAFRGKFHS
jgi:hypothetical protein